MGTSEMGRETRPSTALRGAAQGSANSTLSATGSSSYTEECLSTPFPYVTCSVDSQCRTHGLGHSYCNQYGHCSCYDYTNVDGRDVRQCYNFPLMKCSPGPSSSSGGQVRTLPDSQIPGYGQGACSGELDRCYQYYGFQDGECSCHNGGTWYSWVCQNAWTYGGCSSNCVQGCPDDRR